ncbi:PstS family phosphate ABC transporter substrate-binding protein [Brevibacillus invocatus]|uniref:PstS family phosphate ABC transporter substrate-binding protein n=1 Tax=Brevibacillus invocatus TaxID=173959 RepID=UPI00203F3B02|nr:substrate-binding domain-containing protein [Brevibacillus invocatus]MCM3079481.1 substrate-binding domain-containing protein [Brevibacillus invocatus]MCM3429467.1 substrate-binding domain-containing protein [Brevibacillus invocatus]
MGEWIGKILGYLAAAFCIAFIGFAILIITLLNGGQIFYAPLVIVVTVVCLIYMFMLFFVPTKLRIANRSLVGLLVVCALTVTGYEINQAYHNSIPTVSEQDFDLRAYQPYQDNTKAQSLGQPATLKLDSNLPRLDGATALYPLYSAFVQAVYPKKEYDLHDHQVRASTTPEAYEYLLDGTADMIFVAGPSTQQLAVAKEKGVEMKLTPIGREAFVFFVHADNPVKGLTTEQIQGIYSGAITNWQEVGGKNEPIRAFQRPENSGSQTALEKFMGNIPIMEPPNENRVSGMGGIIEKTSDYKNYPNAIGYLFRFFATEMVQNGNIRLLEVNGVLPSKATIADQSYPLSSEFYVITAGSQNPNVPKLIDWILSEQGQALVEKTGYTPLTGY